MRSHLARVSVGAVTLWFAASLAYAGTVQQKSIAHTGSGPAGLFVDAQSRIHMSWQSVDQKLHYTRIDGHRKTDQVVDAQAPCGAWSAVALDSAGQPHIAYNAERNHAFVLVYAAFDGTAWHTEELGPGGFATAIAIDAHDQPHIAHEVTSDVPLSEHFEYVQRDDSGWHTEQPPGLDALSSEPISLALDADGHAHVAMDDPTHRQAVYATNASGDWVATDLGDQNPLMGESVFMGSLALDSLGRPHLALHTSNPTTIRYSHFDGAQWQSEDLYDANDLPAGTIDRPQSVSLALDARDRPSILFMDQLYTTENDPLEDLVAYAYRSGASWIGVSVAAKRGYGHWTRLAAAPDGSTVALYGQNRADESETLREARIALADLTGSWTSLTLTPDHQSTRIDGVLEVSNLGPTKSGSPPLAFYLSSDPVLDPTDLPIAFRKGIGAVSPGKPRTVKISLHVFTPVAGKYLIAIVDSNAQLVDRDRANNLVPGLLAK